MTETTPILEIDHLNVRFRGEKVLHAINDLSLRLEQGETLALLGESGPGKSVTLKTLLRLLPPKRSEIEGDIRVNGTDILTLWARAAALSRQRSLHGVSGAGAGAGSGLQDRPADRRGRAAPQGHPPRGRWMWRSTCCAGCGSPRPNGG